MALQFFNTLTRRKEEFVPINPPNVGMYTCGPTVYNYAHIGNFRAFVFEDLLRRYLEYKGYRVRHVMNITDVEDKIIRAVRETGRRREELTEFYTAEFLRDLDTLRIRRAHVMPRATESIPAIIELIARLIEKGHAYVSDDGSVYYSIRTFPEYGKLSHFKLDELRSTGRVQHDEYTRESVADFALWKAWDEADGEVRWASPWGLGRPGWHIECSAMSMQHLGETFDIHCGGEDLIFPHHEDEIAQSEAATGKPFVRYWLHNAHLLVDGRKMSKSTGNFFTLRDLLAKGWTGREVRYALICGHYREPLNFTLEGMQAARAALQRWDEFLTKLQETAGDCRTGPSPVGLVQAFEAALDDDLNISAALGALFEHIRETNKRAVSAEEAAGMLAAWQRFDEVLAFGIPERTVVPVEIQSLVEQRQAARRARDFARADALRAQLQQLGWVVEDTPQGPRLKRLSSQ